jgi:hypothetical protein
VQEGHSRHHQCKVDTVMEQEAEEDTLFYMNKYPGDDYREYKFMFFEGRVILPAYGTVLQRE